MHFCRCSYNDMSTIGNLSFPFNILHDKLVIRFKLFFYKLFQEEAVIETRTHSSIKLPPRH